MRSTNNLDYTTTYDYSGISQDTETLQMIKDSKAYKGIGKEFDKAIRTGKERRGGEVSRAKEYKKVLFLAVLFYLALC